MLGPTPGDLSSVNPSKIHGSSDTRHPEHEARRNPETTPAKPESTFEIEPLKTLLKSVARAENSAAALGTTSHPPPCQRAVPSYPETHAKDLL